MAYIYKITNLINGKLYIGKTNGTIQSRWQDHKSNCKKISKNKRPLYNAMNFYGVENFLIEEIEECSSDISCEREIYWISFYNTYSGEGYNATLGGDGKSYVDYDLIIKEYQKLKNINKVAKKLGYCSDTISTVLKQKGMNVLSSTEVMKKEFGTPLVMFDLNNKFEKTFSSYGEAVEWLKENNFANGTKSSVSDHIRENIKGNRKTAHKHIWKLLNGGYSVVEA